MASLSKAINSAPLRRGFLASATSSPTRPLADLPLGGVNSRGKGVTAPIQAAGALIGRYWHPRVPWVQKVLTGPEMAFQPPFPES